MSLDFKGFDAVAAIIGEANSNKAVYYSPAKLFMNDLMDEVDQEATGNLMTAEDYSGDCNSDYAFDHKWNVRFANHTLDSLLTCDNREERYRQKIKL